METQPSALAIFFTVLLIVVLGAAFITALAFGIKAVWGAGRRWLHNRDWWSGPY